MGYDALLRVVEQLDLPLSVVGPDMNTTMREVIARFPEVKFIIDHCGTTQPHGSSSEWEGVLALGVHRNVWMKWSSALRAFGGAYPFPEAQTRLTEAMKAFGADRIMWA